MHRRHTVYPVISLWDDERNFLLIPVSRMRLRIVFCIPAFFLLSSLVFAAPPIITGKVVDERGAALHGATVTINGTPVSTDNGGRFELEASEADVYMLVYSADGHYSAVHSYSPMELSWFDSGGRNPRRDPGGKKAGARHAGLRRRRNDGPALFRSLLR